MRFNIREFDALHVAAAELGGASTFVSVDDRLLRRSSNADTPLVVGLNPIELLDRLEKDALK